MKFEQDSQGWCVGNVFFPVLFQVYKFVFLIYLGVAINGGTIDPIDVWSKMFKLSDFSTANLEIW